MTESLDAPLAIGGWCWFHSPRAAQWNGLTALGIVAPGRRPGSGRIAVCFIGPHGATVTPLQTTDLLDDHDAPALTVEGDSLVAGWTRHAGDGIIRIARLSATNRRFRRRSGVREADVRVRRLAEVDLGLPTTYVSFLPAPDDVWRIVTRVARLGLWVVEIDRTCGRVRRSAPLLWHDIAPDDPLASGRDGGRPYAVVRAQGDRAWFAATNDHPRAYRSGVWCGYLEGSTVHDADGNPVRALNWRAGGSPGSRPAGDAWSGLSSIVPAGRPTIPWVHDLAFTAAGRPVVALSVSPRSEEEFRHRPDVDSTHLRYAIAEQDEAVDGPWTVRDIAPAGSNLCEREGDYAGGIALDPADPHLAVFSSDIPPVGHEAVGERRLYVAHLHGARPRFLRLGGPHEPPALRPLMTEPTQDGHVLAYLTGRYTHYTDYDLSVMVLPFVPGRSCWDGPAGHIDLPFPIGPDVGLPDRERTELASRLAHARRYLEYGAGGSTLLALDSSTATITSIESDSLVVKAVRAAAARSDDPGRLDIRDHGWPLAGQWGYPLAGDSTALGRAYVESADDVTADLVLIDGRFRVAAFLRRAVLAAAPVTVLWDDYRGRAHYHVVEQWVRPAAIVGRMAVFELDGPISVPPAEYDRALGLPD